MNKDIYAFILFALYKMREDENYSTLSKLIYLLDEKQFLMFCKYFGGQTITVPTTYDLKVLITALNMFCEIDINGKDYDKEFLKLRTSVKRKDVREAYKHIKESVDGFAFGENTLFTE